MEKKVNLDILVFSTNIILYMLIYLYSINLINSYIFAIVFYIIFSKVFVFNHDRTHTTNSNYNKFFETIVELTYVAVVPWEEQYNSYKKKHLIHHRFHKKSSDKLQNYRNNPHILFEKDLKTAFFSSLFYSEIQFFINIINKNITFKEILFIFWYSILISSYIFYFSFEKFILIFCLVRITGFLSWFVFSYILHHPYLYGKEIPKMISIVSDLAFGKRLSRGTLFHKKHHDDERIPSHLLK